ncbi:NRT1/ PTR FAMILY 5.1-like protein [Drosera capensis]
MASMDYTRDGTVDLRGRPVLASKTGKWKAAALLVGYEAFERMAFYGIQSNLVVYLTTELREGTVSSVTNVNNWSGAVWMTPILGAYIADAFLGRFWTFTIASAIYVVGMSLLTMAVSLKSLRPYCTSDGICSKASPLQIGFFYMALYIIAVGAGGTKPNISTFGADQFDELNPHEKKLKASFFNWWMFSAYFGSLFANSGLIYIQDNLSWSIGYGIPTIGLILSLVCFYIGTPLYRHKPKNGNSHMKEIIHVLSSALGNWRLKLPSQPFELHELEREHYVTSGEEQLLYIPCFRFLDKASVEKGNVKSPCTVTQVQKLKLFCGMFIIWVVLLIPSAFWAEVSTIFVKQGTTLNCHLGSEFKVPPASLSSIYTLSMILAVPVYDRYFVPFMRKRTGNPRGITILQRLGIGCAVQVSAIVAAYVVEVFRLRLIKEHHINGPQDIVPMSIFWQLPQYGILGLADVFLAIGMIEFFYDQSPQSMQSLGTTFFTSAVGVGSFLNGFLVNMVDKVSRKLNGGKSWIGNNLNDSHLDYFFVFLTVIGVVNLAAFMWASCAYTYKNEVAEEDCDLSEKQSIVFPSDCAPLEGK